MKQVSSEIFHCSLILCSLAFLSGVNGFAGINQRQVTLHQKKGEAAHQPYINNPVSKNAIFQRPRGFRFLATGEDSDGEENYEEEYSDEEYEYVYEEVEEEVEEEDIDSSFENIPLEDDEEDENYMAQKKAIEESSANRATINKLQLIDSSTDFFRENVDEFLDTQLKEAGVDMKMVEEKYDEMAVSEEEVEAAISESSFQEDVNPFKTLIEEIGTESDSFPPDKGSILESFDSTDVSNENLTKLQKALEDLVGTMDGMTDGSLVDNKQAMIRPQYEFDQLDDQTRDEIQLCLNASATDAIGVEYGESIKNEDPLRWLLYDLNFNVTNLMLAACKHSPNAPLLLNHWMPQLCAYSRYADVRQREFQFTSDDCANADTSELLKYYQGLGYDEIPTFSPKDTNIVEVETEYDQEDVTMSHFENWMEEVYDEEGEDLYFDDETFQPENNVFDQNFGLQEKDEVTTFKAEFKDFEHEYANETQAWRDKYAKESNYTIVDDSGGQEEFRGHVVVACCGSDHDLELAEKITLRMEKEFGKKVYVETRVYNHARQEDNLYEIWIESYDIELIHSRRGAFYNAKQWLGPADIDDPQLDYIVDKVEYCISEDARYSYHLHEFVTEV